MGKESEFERRVAKDIRSWSPLIRVFKLDPNAASQGVPDRIVLYKGKFAMLEFKRSATAKFQPNQKWYIKFFNKHGFASAIYPENSKTVLNDLKKYLKIKEKK